LLLLERDGPGRQIEKIIESGAEIGYAMGKKINGHKRYILVDKRAIC
jgi:hypothetical protein